MSISLSDLTVKQLKQVIQLREKIEVLEKQLDQILSDDFATPIATGPLKRRIMSASHRRSIAAAQRARWAKWKARAPKARTRRKMSAAARAKISAAAQARWARIRAAR
jgi:hypothetical protein